jgi:hypothetical protein
MFKSYISDTPTAINPNLRRAIFATVLPSGTESDFSVLLKIYRTTPSADEREDIWRDLGSFRTP